MVDLSVKGKSFEAELADSAVKKFLGMRFRSSGKMLFVFGSDTRAIIDMFFVPVPLQLYFLNGEKQVVEVHEAKPWSFYRPETDYRYLLESTENLDLEEGDRLEFQI